jgi:Tfp pilus assembly protein PilF
MGWKKICTLVLVLGLASCSSPSARHIKKGRVYLNSGNLDKAEVEFQKASAEDPENAEAYFGLGYVLFRRDRLDEAIEEYKKGMAIDPNDPDSHYYLGLIYNEKNMQDEAREELKLYDKLKRSQRR